MEIKEKTTVHEAIKRSKEVIKVFKKYNLDCPSCRGSAEETMEKVAVNNGLDIKKFLKELNEAAAGQGNP